jgi:hypothetical protein
VQVLKFISRQRDFLKISKVTVGVILFVVYFLSCSTPIFAKRKSDPVLDFALQQIEQKYYQPAISTLNTFLETHKNDTSALYWKAHCFL